MPLLYDSTVKFGTRLLFDWGWSVPTHPQSQQTVVAASASSVGASAGASASAGAAAGAGSRQQEEQGRSKAGSTVIVTSVHSFTHIVRRGICS
jgi:hypothetical protein